jgi:hypothetical protein
MALFEKVQQLERRIEQAMRGRQGIPTTKEEFDSLAGDLEALWKHPETDVRLKKRIVRTLSEEVVVDVDGQTGEIIAVVHWKGGVHTEVRIPRRRRGYSRAHTPPEIVDAVRVLVRICSDDTIAGALSRSGLVTGMGNRWTRERVTRYAVITAFLPIARSVVESKVGSHLLRPRIIFR